MVRLRPIPPLEGWPYGCECQDYAPSDLIASMEAFLVEQFGLAGDRWVCRLERPLDIDRFYFRDADAFDRFTKRFG